VVCDFHSHYCGVGLTISTFVGGICVPPGKPELERPQTYYDIIYNCRLSLLELLINII
jgi:hypothetical protein